MKPISNSIKAGFFVFIALLLFVSSIWMLGSEREIFTSQEEFYAVFKDVKGLREGAPVRLGGIPIGRIKKVELSNEISDASVNVTFLVNEKYLERIRNDSTVSIDTQGLLGDKFLNVTIGVGVKILPIKSVIKTSETRELAEVVSKAGSIIDNAVDISNNLKNFSGGVSGSGGNDLANALRNLSEVLLNLNNITSELKTGNGVAHAVIYDKDGSKVIKDMVEVAQNLLQATKDSDQLKLKVSKILDNLDSVVTSIKNGEGSLGALLMDPRVYEGLVSVMDNAKRSVLLREAIKAGMGR